MGPTLGSGLARPGPRSTRLSRQQFPRLATRNNLIWSLTGKDGRWGGATARSWLRLEARRTLRSGGRRVPPALAGQGGCARRTTSATRRLLGARVLRRPAPGQHGGHHGEQDYAAEQDQAGPPVSAQPGQDIARNQAVLAGPIRAPEFGPYPGQGERPDRQQRGEPDERAEQTLVNAPGADGDQVQAREGDDRAGQADDDRSRGRQDYADNRQRDPGQQGIPAAAPEGLRGQVTGPGDAPGAGQDGTDRPGCFRGGGQRGRGHGRGFGGQLQ